MKYEKAGKIVLEAGKKRDPFFTSPRGKKMIKKYPNGRNFGKMGKSFLHNRDYENSIFEFRFLVEPKSLTFSQTFIRVSIAPKDHFSW